jgi:hypothetical protein
MLIIALLFFFAFPAQAMEDHIDVAKPDNKTWVPLSETALRAHNRADIDRFQKFINDSKHCTAQEPQSIHPENHKTALANTLDDESSEVSSIPRCFFIFCACIGEPEKN